DEPDGRGEVLSLRCDVERGAVPRTKFKAREAEPVATDADAQRHHLVIRPLRLSRGDALTTRGCHAPRLARAQGAKKQPALFDSPSFTGASEGSGENGGFAATNRPRG